MSSSLDELHRLVEDEYEREARKHPARRLSLTHLSSLDEEKPEITRLDVLEAWKELVDCLEDHFVEYEDCIQDAFLLTVSIQDDSIFPHFRTLVHLLRNTVENKHKDNSTECRFVTLLEVLLSYGDEWEPSEEVERLWVRLMQRIPAACPPLQFRRKAYRVLVSLSWVPSSQGLLEACSFQENSQFASVENAPPAIQKVLSRIRPLPRYDCVNQLLDRLKDETDVCVAISSEQPGMGKTTLAALVAAHPSIVRVFRVLWLDTISTEPLTYDAYVQDLNTLCQQLEVTPQWPEYITRFEEAELRSLREKQCKEHAKEIMAQILLEKDENVLLILDDVVDADRIEWYRFTERQSVIVTTPDAHLAGVDWTVELEAFSPEEAVELFLDEASLPTSHILGATTEVLDLMKHVQYNPLYVRTLARWFHLKYVPAGIVDGMKEMVKDIHEIETGEDHEGQKSNLLYDILSLMLGPQRMDGSTTILFVLCFAAMVVVFPDRKVPLDAVLLLWEQLMQVEEHAMAEMKKICENGVATPQDIRRHAWYVAEGLTHMGVVIVSEENGNPWIETHHKSYRDFAAYMAREMDLGDSYEDTAQEWNQAFVTAYFTRRIQSDSNDAVDSNSWDYAIQKLPDHMFRAKIFSMGETILSDENFFGARLEALGWKDAIEVHVRDCVKLQRSIEEDDAPSMNSSTILSPLSPVFANVANLVTVGTDGPIGSMEPSYVVGVSRALYKIAFALADMYYYEDAIRYFEDARKLLPQSQNLRASILYGGAWALLCSNEVEKAKRKIKSCLKIMGECEEIHPLYTQALQLQADTLVSECEYKAATKLTSTICESLRAELPGSRIELAVSLYKKGRLHQMMGDFEEANLVLSESLAYKLEIGESSRNLAHVYCALGDVNVEMRRAPEAKEYFESALVTLDALRGGREDYDHFLVVGKLRFLRHDLPGSIEAFGKVMEWIKASPFYLFDRSARDLRSVARSYHAKNDLTGALNILRQALALTSSSPHSLERSAVLQDMANCLLDQGSDDDGVSHLEKSLEIKIIKLGESPQVVSTLKTMGKVHLSIAAYDEALKVFEKVLELNQKISPEDYENIAHTLLSIGDVYVSMEDDANAAVTFNHSLAVLHDRSTDHHYMASALHRLGDIAVRANDLEEGKIKYSEALRIRKMHFDEGCVAETQHALGVVYRKEEMFEEAYGFLHDALEIRERLANAREIGETLLELGNVLRVQSDVEESIVMFEKAKDFLERDDIPDVLASVYLSWSHACITLGRYDDALDLLEDAQSIRVPLFGKDDARTGNVFRSLGLAHFLAGNYDDALICLNEYVRVCEKLDEEDEEGHHSETMDYVLSVLMLGDIHKEAGRIEQAMNVWSIGREIVQENRTIAADVPALESMLESRLQSEEPEQSPSPRQTTALLAKLQDVGSGSSNGHSRDEAVLRQIVFVDE